MMALNLRQKQTGKRFAFSASVSDSLMIRETVNRARQVRKPSGIGTDPLVGLN